MTTTVNNLTALGRFKPGTISGIGGGQEIVTLKTNLAGEPLRFTFHESLSSIVSNGTLVMLDASISELGEQQDGVLGPALTEDDEAMWGTATDSADVEPNEIVHVWEIKGSFTSSVSEDNPNLTIYELEDDTEGEMCHTIWRVVSFSSYVDENDVPYCDIELESLTQGILDATIQEIEFIVYDKTYWDDLLYHKTELAKEEGENLDYDTNLDPINNLDPIMNPETPGIGVTLIESPEQYFNFLWPSLESSLDTSEFNISTGDLESIGVSFIPVQKVVSYGEEVWQVIQDVCNFNDIVVRWKRDYTMVTWNSTEPGLGETIDVGDFARGLTVQYTKAGVINKATVKGYLGEKNVDGRWIPDVVNPITVKKEYGAATNILNGKNVSQVFEIPADYLLSEKEQIENWGIIEMYKSVIQARTASYSSEKIPFEIEVGHEVTGTSSYHGTVSFLVTSLDRTTDAQRNTSTTSLSGNTQMITGIGWV